MNDLNDFVNFARDRYGLKLAPVLRAYLKRSEPAKPLTPPPPRPKTEPPPFVDFDEVEESEL